MKIRKRKNKETKVDKFQQQLNTPSNEENIKQLEDGYLSKVKEKNKKTLIKLDYLERERIARHIKDLYLQEKTKHRELCDEIDEYDRTYRMERRQATGVDSDMPNYVTPVSTVVVEVIHANYMNVFFTPKDTMRIIPTEAGDIPKIKKLDIFGNWSMKNEMELFEKCDRLFHASSKNGTNPYMVHWVKEHGTEIKIEVIPNPANPSEPLLDPDTKEPLYIEREIPKLLYNGPKLEIFSRKDYILPSNAMADKKPDWEMRIVRLNADKVNRYTEEGKFYEGVFGEIGGWTEEKITDKENTAVDKKSAEIPLGKTEKLFIEFYGTLRINRLKEDKNDEESLEELEDEFIAIMEMNSETLCSLRKNKFPLKMRPIGMDGFIPDDEGRVADIGIMEFMDSIQKGHDALYNQYIFGTIQSNDPFGFFSPTGNTRDEPIKVRHGYLYPTSDPGSVNIVKLPPPDASLLKAIELARYWAQILFGIGEYQAGIESTIDPSAPAKKAEIVVGQGNVRLNLIIKRKNKTLRDIFKRWFLLYQANMPPNKFMRIAGEDKDNPWKFEAVNLTDFALNSIPDFELTGNILNSNKQLEAQKALAVYNSLITNPLFNAQSQQGLQALHALTKWFMDKLDETGISDFLPSVGGKDVLTPEEENARFLQGDVIEPKEGEDYVYHMRNHGQFIMNPNIPPELKAKIITHMGATVTMMKKAITNQIVQQQTPQPQQGGQGDGQAGAQGAPGQAAGPVPVRGMARPQTGNQPGL